MSNQFYTKDRQEDEPVRSTNGKGESFATIMERRLSRRSLLKGMAAASAAVAAGSVSDVVPAAQARGVARPNFAGIAPSTAIDVNVADGHTTDVLIRWGDPVTADAPAFDPNNLTAEAQSKQFGYNCDFVGFVPLPFGSGNSDQGLLVVNHEYTNPELMFTGYSEENPTRQQVDVELAAHGLAVIEVQRANGKWAVNSGSQYNRRITALETAMTVTGPAAGHDLLKTSADASGTNVIGTLNNCAGGKTPWGTILSAEENFHQYFANLGLLADGDPIKEAHDRYGTPNAASDRKWENYYDRFDVSKVPNEQFRFGWMIEVDPYDPNSVPVKRTALGRMRHEAATIAVAPNGRVVAYSGDDARFEYMYKFVTSGTYNAGDRAANMGLLDDGVLYVAKLNDDGSGEWLPLVYGQGPLTEENGFGSQGEVLIKTRQAADLLGATKMDRPEDMEANPVTGRVYVALTNNTRRGTEGNAGVDPANPRAENANGHVLEIIEGNNDPTSTTFNWEIFMLCGDPEDASTYFAGFPKDQVSSIANPDNVTFDIDGNLWISTDGQPRTLEANDSVYMVPVEGPERGNLQRFFNGVPGGEICGPEFTPDNTSFFVAIQHPGEGGTFDAPEPAETWPDFQGPPRPSLVVIQANDSGRVGLASPLVSAETAPQQLPATGTAPLISPAVSGPLVATLGLVSAAAGVIIRRRMKAEAEAQEANKDQEAAE
jgi:secreted PhoX family phosphatase